MLAKRIRFRAAGILPSLGFVSKDKAVEASYCFAWEIAKEKSHTIRERLIKSCATNMVKLVCGKEQRKKISLSNDTARRRISNMFQDILD